MKLIDMLPEYYQDSDEVVELQNALQLWADRLRTERDEFLAQLNVRTATWGLKIWEEALGIKTDISKSRDIRRTRVESKLRGIGVITPVKMESIVSGFTEGSVEVTEYSGEFRFVISIFGQNGFVTDMQGLRDAVREAKPAHLAFGTIVTTETPHDPVPLRIAGGVPYNVMITTLPPYQPEPVETAIHIVTHKPISLSETTLPSAN